VVQPQIAAPGLFSKKEGAEVWISDDSARILVQIKSHVKFGSLRLALRSYVPALATKSAELRNDVIGFGSHMAVLPLAYPMLRTSCGHMAKLPLGSQNQHLIAQFSTLQFSDDCPRRSGIIISWWPVIS
jgi:hypothetical protein